MSKIISKDGDGNVYTLAYKGKTFFLMLPHIHASRVSKILFERSEFILD